MNGFYLSDIKEDARIHFIGIGGISMSALAHVCLECGYSVSGSDIMRSPSVEALEKKGVKIFIGHNKQNALGSDLVVYTAAINPENEELSFAIESGIKAIERSVFLGAVMRGYKNRICIAGTHGKTTTTSMMSHVLMESGCNPTIMLGGELDYIGGNMRLGGNDYFLTEACEYHCSFLEFFPDVAVITNVEEDHLDYFKDIDHIKDAFRKFAALPGESGYTVVCGDDKNAKECVSDTDAQVITYGFGDDNIFSPKNLVYTDGCGEFDIEYDGSIIHTKLNCAGKHNVLNALACYGAGYALGLSGEDIKKGLEAFFMVHRRFEKKGEMNGALVIDDYAHHPTEIHCTLDTAKKMCKGRLYVVFQPHTYTRTKLLIDDFEKAFDDADEIIVTDIYAAREKNTGLIHARTLADRLAGRGKAAVYISDFGEIENYLKNTSAEGDIIITMGAGDVYKIGDALIKK